MPAQTYVEWQELGLATAAHRRHVFSGTPKAPAE